MKNYYRIIDANINRASEGLRVLEDMVRFKYNDREFSEKTKRLRHFVRDGMMGILSKLLEGRDSQNDVGLEISQDILLDDRKTFFEMAAANFKRVQEAMRTVEENLKLVDMYDKAKIYENYRYQAYNLEKEFRKFNNNKKSKLDTDLYCLTCEKYSKGRSNPDVVKAMIDGGVRLIQYREKEKNMRQKYEECLEIRRITREAGAAFIVNDHVDIAMLVEADGVHMGQDDLPVEKVRELVGDEMIIGLSTHSVRQAVEALKTSVDYIGVGPIYETFTKKDVCAPVGLGYLEYAAGNVNIPFVAIGGIKEHNMYDVKSRGASLIAMVTEIVGAKDITAKVKNIKAGLKKMEEKQYE